MEIKLLHLYSDIMNLYGEYGNIRILEHHLKDQGFEVIVENKTIGEDKNFSDYDFIYMGCGTEKNQKVILEDMLKEKESLETEINNGKPILLTGNSFEILGKSIDKEPALGILDFETEHEKHRKTEDVICNSEILKNKVVGFINTASSIKNNNEKPFLEIEWGLDIKYDGIIYKNVLGTHIIGPILERNPEILKLLIERICTQKDKDFKYKDIEYFDEEKGYELVLKELEARKEIK